MANNKEKEPKNKRKFFKDFKAELKKVIWPTPKQLVNNTVAVVVIVIITAAIVFALDFAFELLNKYGINKIKSSVRGNTVIEQIDDENVDEAGANTIENDTAENNIVENSTAENTVENNVDE